MFDVIATDLAESHNGVVSAHMLRSHGVSASAIRSIRESRHWDEPFHGVFVRTGTPATIERDLAISTLAAGPGAALSHEPGFWLWGLTWCRTDPVHIVRTARKGPRPEGVVVHTVRLLPDSWVTEHRGIRVGRPELLAMQAFATMPPGRAERLVERMWSMRLLSGLSLQRFADEMGRSGRNGIGGVREYLEARPGDYLPSASNVETRTMQVLRDVWIEVRPQVNVGSDEVWAGRVDFVVVDLPIVIEVQSQEHHTSLTDAESDRRRRSALEAAGWIWVEVWDTEVWTTPEVVVAKVRAAIAEARRRGLSLRPTP